MAACSRPAPRPAGPDARAGLELGRQAAAQWIAAGNAEDVSASTAIALGYLERLRLGMGSPFRLIDYAARDPRLSDDTRTRLAWALLARTLDGDAYQIDPSALDRAGTSRLSTWPGLGRQHLDLITSAVEESADPRSGELAVRLGYAFAATEGTLPTHAPRYAAQAAALVRDRALARLDAVDVLRAADAQHTNALTVVQQWRTARKLRVEAPPLAPLPQDAERAALDIAPRITESLRTLSAENARVAETRPRPLDIRRSLLGDAAAHKLLAMSDSMPMPPNGALVVGARGYHDELVAPPWLREDERDRRRMLEDAGTEERFAAQFALLHRTSPHDVVPSLVAMWSAVGMRAFSQETVWYPGYPAPSDRELTQRYGLASVTFGDDVPRPWRPYYRRMLDDAIKDLQLVLPSLDVNGLAVRFEEIGPDAGTLAMHDPRKRRLVLPPSTAAGTLAHEIAHDVDWQVAMRRYSVKGDYASDRALRTERTGDRFALRMLDLSVGTPEPQSTTPKLIAHAKRPAEIFARNMDWFVAATLAGRGRMNGYLSSVQDELLTGYGTVRAPEITGVAADAMVRILDEIAPVYPETRDYFLRNYGSGRNLRSYDLARRVFEAEVPDVTRSAMTGTAADLTVFDGIRRARDLGDRAIDAWTCRTPGGAYNAELEHARRELVSHAAAARARGYAIARSRAVMGRNASAWTAGQLIGAPWQGEGVSDEMRDYLGALVEGAQGVRAEPAIASHSGFTLSAPLERCAPGSGARTFPSF
jgi:hypothetical protein